MATLAWNTAIQNLFDSVFGGTGSKLAGQFVYATLITTLITIVVIFAAIAVGRAAKMTKRTEEERRG